MTKKKKEELLPLNRNMVIDNKIKEISKLIKNKNKSEDQLRAEATVLVLADELDIGSLFIDSEEKKKAKELSIKYLREYTPETVSDINNLRSLLYLEIIQNRLQVVMNNLSSSVNSVPLNLIDSIHKNLKEITVAKERLGLIGGEKEQQVSDGYKAFETVKLKFKKWLKNNQGSRNMVCPSCGKMVLLKLRMDKWEESVHPFFNDRLLCNRHLMYLYAKKKITKKDVALVYETSDDYIDWLITKGWGTNKEYLEMMKDGGDDICLDTQQKPLLNQEKNI